jgi:nudix-type nucleoside diphosphatase (YffH/AdpP family)
MSARVRIETVETLSKGWAHLRRYTIAYTRRDGRCESQLREVHDHGHGAAVLPFDCERGTVLLVRQFRLPAYLCGEEGDLIEACAGLLDGNSPEVCARREAIEELGYRIDNLRQVASAFMTPGAVTERLTMFLADYRADWKVGAGGGHTGEGEDIEVIEIALAAALEMVDEGAIIDAKTIALLLFLERELRLKP